MEMGLIQESIDLAINGNRRELARLLSAIEAGA